MNQTRPGVSLLLFSAVVVFATCLHAAVTNVAWYRLGENDPGATSGGLVTNTTTDLVGVNHLKQFGSPRYTNAVSASASNQVGSALAVRFNGANQSLSNAIVSPLTNNFGVEMWVRPDTTNAGPNFIAVNGNSAGPGSSGWAIFQTERDYRAVFPGVVAFGSFGTGTATPGTWDHVALVRDGGTSTLYVNGISVATSALNPRLPTIGFALGTHPNLPAGEFFGGAIDEVRVFTFAAGQFSTNDLLFNLQRVVTLPATGIASTNVTLNGTVNPVGLPTSAWFEWGATTNYGNVTAAQSIGSGINNTNFSQVLAGLGGGVTYHFRAVASNNVQVARGANQSFTTLSTPLVSTLPAVISEPTTATLNGVGNPQGTVTAAWFQWGTTTNYGNVTLAQVLGNDLANTNFSQVLAGLFAGGTVYHFRAVASNSFGVVFGVNRSFTLTNVFFVEALSAFGGGDGWLAPGESSFLDTNNNARGLGFGNDHLYLVSRNGGNSIRILNKLTGADLGSLNTNGISGGTFEVNMIAVGGDGAIYVNNLTVQSTSSPLKIYKWATEGSVPTIAYSGDAMLPGARVGDSMAAIGSGPSTRLALGFGSTPPVEGNDGYAIIDPTAGTATAVGFISFNPQPGDFRLSISFSSPSHLFGKQQGVTYRYTSFSGNTGTLVGSANLNSSSDHLLAYAFVGGRPLLAVQNTTDATVSIYDVTTPENPSFLISKNNTSGTLIFNANGVGQLAWGDFSETSARLYAMSANHGIQAFVVSVYIPRPVLSVNRFGNEIVLSWPSSFNLFALQSSTNIGPSAVWTAVSPPPWISGGVAVVTNSISGNARFYRLRK